MKVWLRVAVMVVLIVINIIYFDEDDYWLPLATLCIFYSLWEDKLLK